MGVATDNLDKTGGCSLKITVMIWINSVKFEPG